MNKRKGRKGTLNRWTKRARVSSIESDFSDRLAHDYDESGQLEQQQQQLHQQQQQQQQQQHQQHHHQDHELQHEQQPASWLIKPEDMIENKVDIIIKDAQDNCRRSLTIKGKGLGVEKTIAVVEAIKRNYLKHETRYTQETSIKAAESNQAHLQVVLTLLDLKDEATNDTGTSAIE